MVKPKLGLGALLFETDLRGLMSGLDYKKAINVFGRTQDVPLSTTREIK